MFCSKCGHEIAGDSLFCAYCGNRVSSEQLTRKNEFSKSNDADREKSIVSADETTDFDEGFNEDYDVETDDEDVDEDDYIILSRFSHDKVNDDEVFSAIERYNPVDLSKKNIDNTITVLKGVDFSYCSQSFYTEYPTSEKYIKKRLCIPKKPKPKYIRDNRGEYEKKLNAVEQKARLKDVMAWVKENMGKIGPICLVSIFVALFLSCFIGDYIGGFRPFIIFLSVFWIVGVGCGCFIMFKKDRESQTMELMRKIEEIEAKISFAQKENIKEEEKYREEMALIPQKREELKRKYKKQGEKYYDLELANRILKLVAEKRILAPQYYSVAGRLCKYIEDGRADSIKEAINLLVEEQHRDKLERMQELHNSIIELEQREQTRAMKAQEEAARRQEEEARRQTEAAQRAAKAQEEAVRVQEKALQAKEKREKAKEWNERGSSAQCLSCINQIGCQYKNNPPKNCGAFRSKYAK